MKSFFHIRIVTCFLFLFLAGLFFLSALWGLISPVRARIFYFLTVRSLSDKHRSTGAHKEIERAEKASVKMEILRRADSPLSAEGVAALALWMAENQEGNEGHKNN